MKPVLILIKTNILKYSLAIIAYFSPIHILMLLIGCGIIIDTYFGRWAAKNKAIKEGLDVRLYVSSKKTRQGLISKMLTYNTVMISLFIIDNYMLNDLFMYFVPSFPIHFFITKAIGFIIILMEYDSIDEKYYKIKGVSVKQNIKVKIKQTKITVLKIIGFKEELEDKLK